MVHGFLRAGVAGARAIAARRDYAERPGPALKGRHDPAATLPQSAIAQEWTAAFRASPEPPHPAS